MEKYVILFITGKSRISLTEYNDKYNTSTCKPKLTEVFIATFLLVSNNTKTSVQKDISFCFFLNLIIHTTEKFKKRLFMCHINGIPNKLPS